jgi:hypothetical protein
MVFSGEAEEDVVLLAHPGLERIGSIEHDRLFQREVAAFFKGP